MGYRGPSQALGRNAMIILATTKVREEQGGPRQHEEWEAGTLVHEARRTIENRRDQS